MKYFKNLIVTLASLVFLFGCSDDKTDSSNPVGVLGGGGTGGTGGTGGNGNVAITISFQSDQQGGGVFSGTPSVAVKLNSLTVSVPAQQYTESFQFDGTETAAANVTEAFLQYAAGSGITTGQQWTFQFEGTLAADGKAFNITSNFTIP